MKRILEIKNMAFITASKRILNGVDWNVENGERWALLGANGAGKTSLMSTICGLNYLSGGEMSVCGKKYSECDWSKIKERIAIVSAGINRHIEPTETVLETVVSGAYAMVNFWGEASETVCRRAVRKMRGMKIERLAPCLMGDISNGERQRVLIARALMINPSVLFLDEPCSGLDPVARDKFVSFLNEIAKAEKIPAIVLATHYLEEIPPSFTHALILKDGKTLAAGKIGDVVNSENLSAAYGAKCVVYRRNGRFFLRAENV